MDVTLGALNRLGVAYGSGGGGSGTSDMMPVFQASDITGSTDVTSELLDFLVDNEGKQVYIPSGRYRIALSTTNLSVNVLCASDSVFVTDYKADNYAIYIRYESLATEAQNVSALSEVRWFFKERVTRATVANASVYQKGDVVHIHSQNGWLNGGTDNRRIGFSTKVLFADTVNNYLYLSTRTPLTPLMTTGIRIRKYTQTKSFRWVGGKFTANGIYDDVSLGDQNNRRACIEIMGLPYPYIRDVEFDETWGIGIRIRSCPYWDIKDIRTKRLPNLFTVDATPIAITGITKANPAVVTVADASTLSNNDDIVLYGIVGMTELNSRVFRVANKSGNTFQLLDYYGGGTANIDSSGMGTYVSGGFVSEGDINALGYGVSVYGASCHGVLTGCKGEEGRHGIVTSDGITDGTYTDAEWATYGFPHYVHVSNCSHTGSYGIAFDTHEEAVGWTFSDCTAYENNRGPEGGSYPGCGFQLRGINHVIKNCSVTGGHYGVRVSQSDTPIRSRDLITGCVFRDQRSASDGEGFGLSILPEDSSPTFVNDVFVEHTTFMDCGTGIDFPTVGFSVTLGHGVSFIGCEEGIDISKGDVRLKALGMVSFDVTNSPFTSPHFAIRLGSETGPGVGSPSWAILLGGAILRHNSTNSIAALFDERDTLATKYYYCPTGMFIQDDEGGTAATLLEAGETTLDLYADATVI
jgi:hypothetical protein